jgi:hypothetical protein
MSKPVVMTRDTTRRCGKSVDLKTLNAIGRRRCKSSPMQYAAESPCIRWDSAYRGRRGRRRCRRHRPCGHRPSRTEHRLRQDDYLPPPIIPAPRTALSKQQRGAFNLIYEHSFGWLCAELAVHRCRYNGNRQIIPEKCNTVSPSRSRHPQELRRRTSGIHSPFSAVDFESQLVRRGDASASNERGQITRR